MKHLLGYYSSDITEDVLESVGTELQAPHKLCEVCVYEGARGSTLLLVQSLGPHPHIFHLGGVWNNDVPRLIKPDAILLHEQHP